MTDARELLELAARAAGGKWHMHDSVTYIDRGGPVWEKWDPLNDDGDSRRLQVALGIDLRFCVDCWAVSDGYMFERAIKADDLECENIRMAIVEVAAEIGRRMPK